MGVCSAPSTLPRTALSSTLSSARLRPSGSTPPSTTPPLLSPLCTTWSTPLPTWGPPPLSDLPTPPTSVFAPTMLARGLPAKPCRHSTTFKTAIHLRQQSYKLFHHVWVEGHPSCHSKYHRTC